MSNRFFNSKFWDDEYVTKLNEKEKVVFIYLFTNSFINFAGVYEIMRRKIAFDTGVPDIEVINILEKFETEEKILYIDGWVVVINCIRHQKHGSPTVIKSAEKRLEEIPEGILGKIKLHKNFSIWMSHVPKWFKQKIDTL